MYMQHHIFRFIFHELWSSSLTLNDFIMVDQCIFHMRPFLSHAKIRLAMLDLSSRRKRLLEASSHDLNLVFFYIQLLWNFMRKLLGGD